MCLILGLTPYAADLGRRYSGPNGWRHPICADVQATDLMVLLRLAETDLCGVFLLEQNDGRLVLWRLSESEPDDTALAPAALWPLLLPERSR